MDLSHQEQCHARAPTPARCCGRRRPFPGTLTSQVTHCCAAHTKVMLSSARRARDPRGCDRSLCDLLGRAPPLQLFRNPNLAVWQRTVHRNFHCALKLSLDVTVTGRHCHWVLLSLQGSPSSPPVGPASAHAPRSASPAPPRHACMTRANPGSDQGESHPRGSGTRFARACWVPSGLTLRSTTGAVPAHPGTLPARHFRQNGETRGRPCLGA